MAKTSSKRVRRSAKKNLRGSVRIKTKKRKATQALRYRGNKKRDEK